MKKFLLHITIIFLSLTARAQDPHFSQFFMAQQLMNPASVGTTSEGWRISSNYRKQWGNAGTPISTATVGMDWKMNDRGEEASHLGGGIMLMADQSMNNAFKSVYASGSLAYHARLSEKQQLGLGMQASFGNRRIDYSRLTFGEQFTSGGFDMSLPSGEMAISKMKSFISLGAGLLYRYQYDYINLDFGVSAFHVNKPAQTYVQDENQVIPIRWTSHVNIDYVASELVILNAGAIFQQQAKQQYVTVGGAVSLDISGGERANMLTVGGWYRSGDAVYPYVGILKGDLQFGMSYDITVSKQKTGAMNPQSFEFSLLLRQPGREKGILYCPWR